MRILFISRSTLFSQPGGDTLQVEETAKYLRKTGQEVDIVLSGQPHPNRHYDIIHFFNLIRPADLTTYLDKKTPLVISSIYADYSEYQLNHSTGLYRNILKLIGKHKTEYLKTIARWLKGSDKFPGWKYIIKGQRKSMQHLLRRADHIICCSEYEAGAIRKELGPLPPYSKIALGSEHIPEVNTAADREGVLCVARIEGLKNQLNLIKALKGSKLTLVGEPAPNHMDYYIQCKNVSDGKVAFIGKQGRDQLAETFSKHKVHALISYHETTGLSTIEALKSGCSAVVSDRGPQREIFGDHVYYCQPEDLDSIKDAIRMAGSDSSNHSRWVKDNFSWEKAARDISDIYHSIMAEK